MKQIPILSGRCLVVELPEGVIKPHINHVGSSTFIVCHTKSAGDGYNQHNIQIPPGNWRIIGMLGEVTEKTLSTVLDSAELNEGRRLYNIHGEPYPNRLTDSALESLESAILAEGHYFSNPLGKEKEYKKSYTGHDMFFANHMVKYYEAQSRVLDRSRCLILSRVE